MTSPSQVRLYNAISQCDKMILLCNAHNEQLRSIRAGVTADALRLRHFKERREAILEQRRNLHALYVETYGVDPWENVAV